MEIDTISTDFWTHLGLIAFRSMPLQRWRNMASAEEIESLIQAGVMTDLPDSQLDGRRDRYDFAGETQSYEIELINDVIRAIPEGPGPILTVTRDQARVLVASPNKLLDFLAIKNGFKFTGSYREIAPNTAEVGRINLNGRQVIWIACFDLSTLNNSTLLAHFREMTENDNLVVVSMPDQSAWPREWQRYARIISTSFPSARTGWLLDHLLFCTPALGFQARDVTRQLWEYAGKVLLIAEQEGSIFLYGHDLKLKSGTRPFNYINELARHSPSPVNFDFFAKNSLKYANHNGLREAAYDDQKKIRKAIESAIPDLSLRAKGIELFRSIEDGKLALPLERKEIYRWALPD